MHFVNFVLIAVLAVIHCFSSASAKCCHEEVGGQCGDNSDATPCCGYKKCNAACCDCSGVQVIREVVELSTATYTSVITAPWLGTTYETWTCRASHITTWLPYQKTKAAGLNPPSNTAAAALTTRAETITATRPATDLPTDDVDDISQSAKSEASAHLQDILDQYSNGTQLNGSSALTLGQYMAFFDVTELPADTRFAESVRQQFHIHDQNGDGYLTLSEMSLLCDQDGCEDPTG